MVFNWSIVHKESRGNSLSMFEGNHYTCDKGNDSLAWLFLIANTFF